MREFLGSLPAPEIIRWTCLDSRCQDVGDMHMSSEGRVVTAIWARLDLEFVFCIARFQNSQVRTG